MLTVGFSLQPLTTNGVKRVTKCLKRKNTKHIATSQLTLCDALKRVQKINVIPQIKLLCVVV